MSSIFPNFRATLRVAATGAVILLAGEAVRAQPPAVVDPRDITPADLELRRRLAPLVPTVRAALEGNKPDAQLAALGIAADFPPAMAIQAKLPAVLATFLQRDGIAPELQAMALRALGRMSPDAPDLAKVAGRHLKSEIVDVRRAAAESLASGIQSSAPGSKALSNARNFVELATVAIPLLNDAMADRDAGVQQASVDGIANAARVVTDLYTYDREPIGDELKPKVGTSRFDQLRPVTRALAASIPQLAHPLSAGEPATRLAAAKVVETLAITRRTALNARPIDEPAPADPLPDGWRSLRPVLGERIKDVDPQVRLVTTEALESLGEALEARELLRQATTDQLVFVRWAAARALGRSAPDKPVAAAVVDDVAALARLTADTDPDVRNAALNGLARFGPAAQSATDAVLAAAMRGDVEPRVSAIKALGALQTDGARTIPVLIAGLENSDLRLRRVAAAGLTRFGPEAKAALPELRKAVVNEDPELRLSAAEAILAIERVPRIKEL